MRKGFAVALSGSPGTGKTVVAQALHSLAEPRGLGFRVVELGELALQSGSGQRVLREGPRETLEVDLGSLSRHVRRLKRQEGPLVIVGHLSHLLPVDAIALLRCNPVVLEQRLLARGDRASDSLENADAERIDLILLEALATRKPIYERDTTHEQPLHTADWLVKVIEGKESPSHGVVDWLRDAPPNPLSELSSSC